MTIVIIQSVVSKCNATPVLLSFYQDQGRYKNISNVNNVTPLDFIMFYGDVFTSLPEISVSKHQ